MNHFLRQVSIDTKNIYNLLQEHFSLSGECPRTRPLFRGIKIKNSFNIIYLLTNFYLYKSLNIINLQQTSTLLYDVTFYKKVIFDFDS